MNLGFHCVLDKVAVTKPADIIILDATRINVAPLNQVPGAVGIADGSQQRRESSSRARCKRKGQLLDVILPNLRRQLEASRDYVFAAAGVPQDLFSSQ